jgi:hypothetical protein
LAWDDFGGYDTVCKGFEDHSRLPALAELLTDADILTAYP